MKSNLKKTVDINKPVVKADYENAWRARVFLPEPRTRLVRNWKHLLVDKGINPQPDRELVRKLKAINDDFSIHWIERHRRWGLFINKKTVETVTLNNGEKYTFFDSYPMLISYVGLPQNAYQQLDDRILVTAKLYIRRTETIEYLINRDKREAKQEEKSLEQFHQDIQDVKKESAHEIRDLYRAFTNDVPDFSVPVLKDIKKENYGRRKSRSLETGGKTIAGKNKTSRRKNKTA